MSHQEFYMLNCLRFSVPSPSGFCILWVPMCKGPLESLKSILGSRLLYGPCCLYLTLNAKKDLISNQTREAKDSHQPCLVQRYVIICEHNCVVASQSDSFQVGFQNILGVQTLCHCWILISTI